MRRPYDLVAFMRQEERAHMLNELKEELLSRKDEIDKNEDRDTGCYMHLDKTLHPTLNLPSLIFVLKRSVTDLPSLEFAQPSISYMILYYIIQLAQF